MMCSAPSFAKNMHKELKWHKDEIYKGLHDSEMERKQAICLLA